MSGSEAMKNCCQSSGNGIVLVSIVKQVFYILSYGKFRKAMVEIQNKFKVVIPMFVILSMCSRSKHSQVGLLVFGVQQSGTGAGVSWSPIFVKSSVDT